MPLTLTPVAVTDDDGAVQQYHIAEACEESCNLDDAREAGHLRAVAWMDIMKTAVLEAPSTIGDWGIDDLRKFLCDRAFGLIAAG